MTGPPELVATDPCLRSDARRGRAAGQVKRKVDQSQRSKISENFTFRFVSPQVRLGLVEGTLTARPELRVNVSGRAPL